MTPVFSGVPVIAPDMEFLPELVEDAENGYLVDLSPTGFVAALKKLLDSSQLTQKLSTGALGTAQRKFVMRCQAEKTLAFYARLKNSIV